MNIGRTKEDVVRTGDDFVDDVLIVDNPYPNKSFGTLLHDADDRFSKVRTSLMWLHLYGIATDDECETMARRMKEQFKDLFGKMVEVLGMEEEK